MSTLPSSPSLHLEEDASGWAGILGVNFAWEDLNAAVTFISNTKMDYKMDVRRDTLGIAPALGFADGSRRRIDIPGQLGFGVSYKFLPQLKVDLNYVLYLEKSATIDTYDGEGNSWDLGITAEYTFSPKWKASVGYLYTNIKVDDNQQINEPEEPKLRCQHLRRRGRVQPDAQMGHHLRRTLCQLQGRNRRFGHQVRQKSMEPVGRRHVEVLLINFEGGGFPALKIYRLKDFSSSRMLHRSHVGRPWGQ